MLFTRYNLFKNHGDFVHLNMLKWAMKYVPEFGKKTVPDDETVKSMEIGTGGVDINTVKDATGEEKSKHVPYTDFEVNGASEPTFNLLTYKNGEARFCPNNNVIFDKYSKVVNITDGSTYPGIHFVDSDTINVDGTSKNYITKLEYFKRTDNGDLENLNQDKEFKPYTSVVRDDNSLASQVKVKHDEDNHLTGVSFPATGESYDVEAVNISVRGIVDESVSSPENKEYKKYALQLGYDVDTSTGARKQKIKGITIGDVNDGFYIDLSGLNIMAERLKSEINV